MLGRSYLTSKPSIARRLRYAATPLGFQWSPRRHLVAGGVRFDGITEGPPWRLADLGRASRYADPSVAPVSLGDGWTAAYQGDTSGRWTVRHHGTIAGICLAPSGTVAIAQCITDGGYLVPDEDGLTPDTVRGVHPCYLCGSLRTVAEISPDGFGVVACDACGAC